MDLVEHAAPPNTTVVVFESEHHATLLPWARAVRLPINRRCGPALVLLRSDLSKNVELLVLRHENQVLRRRLKGRGDDPALVPGDR